MEPAQGTLKMELLVNEYIVDENTGKTWIRLDLGNSCFMSFIVPARVKVPKYIQFTAKLEPAECPPSTNTNPTTT